ncbi:MAG: M23 family metallopeptidase [Chloroflexota bacterium]
MAMGIVLIVAAPLAIAFVLGSAMPANTEALAVAPTATPAREELQAAVVPEPSATSVPFAPHPDPTGDRSGPDTRRAAPLGSLTDYTWPIRNARLTQPFGPSPLGQRIVDGAPFHDGIDLASFCGAQITAAHAGTVLAAGRHYDAYMGWVGDLTAYTARLNAKHLWLTLPNVVVIDDGNGYRSVYAHLHKVFVSPGDVVKAGAAIGTEGQTGNATGCHLHYSLFSPDTTSTFGFDADAAARMRLPTRELARVDPLLVLPPLEDAGIH